MSRRRRAEVGRATLRTRLTIVASGTLAVATLVAACTSADPGSVGAPGGANTATPSGPAGSKAVATASTLEVADRFATMAERLPPPSVGATVTAVNFSAIRRVLGISTSDPLARWAKPDVTVLGPGGVPTDWISQAESWEASLGFGPTAPTIGMELSAPPGSITRLEGAFDAGAVEAAIRGPESFGPDVDVVERSGVPILRYRGDELRVSPGRRDTPERLNRPMRFALSPSRLLIARTMADIEAAIDRELAQPGGSRGGTVPGSGEDLLVSLAGGADTVGALTLVGTAYSDDGPSETDWSTARFAVAVGAAEHEGGAAAFAVIACNDEADARDRAGRIEQQLAGGSSRVTGEPWADLVGKADVRVDGARVLVVFPDATGAQLVRIMLSRESLLLLD